MLDHGCGMTLDKMTSTDTPTSSSAAGVLLMDESLHPVWFNMEAVRILGYPQNLGNSKTLRADALGKKIRATLGKQSLRSPSLTELTSGRRRYVCREFRLDHRGRGIVVQAWSSCWNEVLVPRSHSRPCARNSSSHDENRKAWSCFRLGFVPKRSRVPCRSAPIPRKSTSTWSWPKWASQAAWKSSQRSYR